MPQYLYSSTLHNTIPQLLSVNSGSTVPDRVMGLWRRCCAAGAALMPLSFMPWAMANRQSQVRLACGAQWTARV